MIAALEFNTGLALRRALERLASCDSCVYNAEASRRHCKKCVNCDMHKEASKQ